MTPNSMLPAKSDTRTHAWLSRLLLASVLSILAMLQSACQTAGTTGSAQTVADLSWLSGTWRGPIGEQTLEEQWTTPEVHSIAAVVRFLDEDSTNMLELLSISDASDGLTLHIQQWGPNMEPRSATPQVMKLIASGARSVSFQATTEGGLKALRYSSPDAKSLDIAVETIEGSKFDLKLKRVRD